MNSVICLNQQRDLCQGLRMCFIARMLTNRKMRMQSGNNRNKVDSNPLISGPLLNYFRAQQHEVGGSNSSIDFSEKYLTTDYYICVICADAQHSKVSLTACRAFHRPLFWSSQDLMTSNSFFAELSFSFLNLPTKKESLSLKE